VKHRALRPGAEALERASRSDLHEHQLRRLNALFTSILPSNRFYRAKLGTTLRVSCVEDLADLPLTTKADLAADQDTHPPFGTDLTYPLDRYTKLHQTSGTTGRAPIRWLDTAESWKWWARCWGYVYRGAGVGPGDRILFAFSFGPFIGFWAAFAGADQVGALTIPTGGMSTDQRVIQIVQTDATVLCCTPTYALRLAEVAAEMGIDLASSSIRATIHAGEPGASIPATRARIEAMYGARCYDHTGMTELGATGFTCQHQSGVHLIESEFIAETIDPATLQPVAPGERGELVMTNLGRAGSPLIRYRTGDLVELETEPCPCGRTFVRLRGGILGRADDMVTVRGVNIFPSAIEGIVRSYREVAEYRIELRRNREMDDLRVIIERAPALSVEDGEALAHRVAEELHRHLALRIDCTCADPGTLPRFQLKAKRLVRVADD
jgi:phenylacetate-CoA ligase